MKKILFVLWVGCILENVVLNSKTLSLSLWQKVLVVLQDFNLPENSLNLLKNLQLLEVRDSVLFLEAGNQFTRDWVLKHYTQVILKAIASVDPEITKFEISVGTQKPLLKSPEMRLTSAEIHRVDKVVRVNKPILQPLYSDYTFSNFVVGNCNKEALELCRKVALEPCTPTMSLLYLYGHSGLGKTHLLHAIVHSLYESRRNVSVRYTTAIRFLQDFLKQFNGSSSERQKAEIIFRQRYESVDLLLLDDIQFLASKEQTQLSLLQVIERRRMHGRQTLISGDCLPSEMSQRHFKKRLLDRLEECLMVKLELPDAKTRMSFIERETYSFPFPEKERLDICRWIATPAVKNFRVLYGLLRRLQAEYELMNQPITLSSVRMLLCPGASGRTVEAIAEATALAFGVCGEALCSPDRVKKVSFVRKVAMYICREDTEEPLQVIGNYFGRNHSTVISSCNSVAAMLQDNEDLAWRIQEIRYSFGCPPKESTDY